MYSLIKEVIAEIKRDIHTDNLMALEELITDLSKNNINNLLLRKYLSEFPELREPYKEVDDEV
jgi:hypothetical protein|tara:strand:- start:177 stop:365 length:189 start_codon:yes stop_codon:yes gene_type:complete